ncbi:MAG: type II toxin-antitoxin system Phd/YefM family antitoxin [Parachlamydia sp.]|jgi:prevent-host-death family protein|nr:type II toxin-antitoxin system Phd/YefM family antitoxin [Parachlamydia sp.]
MDAQKINFVKFRQNLSEYLSLTKYRHERFVVTNNGKIMGAFVPKEDLDALEAMENESDILAAEEAFARNEFTSWEKAKKELDKHHGLSD